MFEIVAVNDDQHKKDCITACEESLSILSRDNADELINKLLKYAVFLEAKEDDKTVGYCALYANDEVTKKAYISLICIIKEKQKMKYGRLLLEKAIEEAQKRGMEILRLEVQNTNTNAIGFYTHCGFIYEGKCSDKSSYYAMKI